MHSLQLLVSSWGWSNIVLCCRSHTIVTGIVHVFWLTVCCLGSVYQEILVCSHFFPLIIDKWCFETAGEESSDLPRPVYKKKSAFFGFQHALFYLVLALLLLWKKWQMVVLPRAFSTPKKRYPNSKQGRAVDHLSWFCAQETVTDVSV